MSLYNNVAESLSSNGLFGSIKSALNSTLGSVAGEATNALGGGKLAKRVVGMGQSAAEKAAMNLAGKYIPAGSRRMIDAGSGAIGDMMQGKWEDAGLRLLELFPNMSGIASQEAYWGTPTPLFGGITPKEAMRIYSAMRGEKLAKKNLWLIEVSSPLGDRSQTFNLFATEVEYAPFTLSGDKRKVGGAVVDSVQGGEPVEMRLTTMDDQVGTLKRWFESHAAEVVAQDGTVGVPAKYAIKITIVHSFVGLQSGADEYRDCYKSIGLYRPANLEVSLSRREDGLQEVQMTFSQLDTFMKP